MLAISIGAMVGSGIFILPALAVKVAGPSVVLAYLLAGLLVLPAALSKSEMATAMPESGGTYLFIERGMGPLLGTVAGIGTWFALSFKGALALVGGVPYLLLLFDVPQSVVTPVALGLAAVLVVVNLVGAKQTGRLQVVIVVLMLAAMVWFVVGGVPTVESRNYSPFLGGGVGGLLAATALVFVSYAGVTKIASVAEEVEDPGRNIPLGIIGSLAFTTLLYTLIVAVMLGVVDPAILAGSATPMAEAAEGTLGAAGVGAVVLAALLALVSTANAGILSSSRYPFAMSRDKLAPAVFSTVSERFSTPSASIALTGAVLLALVAFVPLLEIAKLASAFQILVFVLINVAVIAFREGSVEYEPTFHSPLYPWVQIFGAVSGALLLTQMGTVPLLGSALITLGGVAWFLLYGRHRVDREGAAVDAVRRQVGRNAVERTQNTFEEWTSGYRVLVALSDEVGQDRERSLLRVAADLARPNDGRVTVVRFDEVPDQVPLSHASEVQSAADVRFEEQTDELADEFDVPIDYGEIVSHDTRHAVVNYADHEGVDMLLMERAAEPGGLRARLFGSDTDWILRHAPCDVALFDDRGLDGIDVVGVLTDEGTYDPAKIAVADAIASESGASVVLNHGIDESHSEMRRRTILEYHERLADLCSAPVRTGSPFPDGGDPEATPETDDLLVVGIGDGQSGSAIADRLRLADESEGSLLLIRSRSEHGRGRLARLLDRWSF